MTTETFTPASPYTISGTGPYAIPFEYSDQLDIKVEIVDGDVVTLLTTSDYTIAPTTYAASGNLTLATALATAYAGKILSITRATRLEQGWVGSQTSRERGLERQIDINTRHGQDIERFLKRVPRLPILSNIDEPSLPVPSANAILVGNPDETGWTHGLLLDDILNYGVPSGSVRLDCDTFSQIETLFNYNGSAGRRLAAAGNYIWVKAVNALYLVQPAGASVWDYDYTGSGGVKITLQETPSGWIRPEQFGILGNGSDETTRLAVMAAWGRRTGYLWLRLTPGKTYSYTNPMFLRNQKSLRIIGNGAALQNIRASTLGASATFANNECLVFDTVHDGANQNLHPVTYQYGQLVDTVAAGATVIPVKAGEPMADYAVGKRALIWGYCMQTTGGYPNTSAYFEYVLITGVSGQNITISRPLVNDFYSDWPVIDANNGPVRILSLSRSGFEETTDLLFDNVVFKADPGWIGGGSTINRNGRVWIGGYRTARLVNCRGEGGMYVMQGQQFEDIGSSFAGEVEIDKVIETVTLRNVDYASINSGTGCGMIHITDRSTIKSLNNLSALHTLLIDNDCLIQGVAAGGVTLMVDTWGTPQTIVRNSRIWLHSTNQSLRLSTTRSAAFSLVNATRLDLPQTDFGTSFMIRNLRPGSVLYNASAEPVFRVTATPRSDGGGRVFMDGELLGGAFTSGDTLYLASHGLVEMTDNRFLGANTQLQTVALSGTNFLLTEKVDRWTRPGRWMIDSKANPLISTFPIYLRPGFLVRMSRITITVQKAYTGASATALLRFRHQGGSPVYANIDLKTVGTRVLDLSGNVGSAGADTLTGVGTSVLTSMEINTTTVVAYAARSEAAIWSCAVEGIQIRD